MESKNQFHNWHNCAKNFQKAEVRRRPPEDRLTSGGDPLKRQKKGEMHFHLAKGHATVTPPAQIQHPPHRLERVERGCADGFSAPRTRGNLSGKPQKWHTTKKGPNFLEYENLDVFLRYERQKILLKHKMHSDKMEDGPLIDGQEPRRRPPHPSALQHSGIPDGSLSGKWPGGVGGVVGSVSATQGGRNKATSTSRRIRWYREEEGLGAPQAGVTQPCVWQCGPL